MAVHRELGLLGTYDRGLFWAFFYLTFSFFLKSPDPTYLGLRGIKIRRIITDRWSEST